MGAPDLPSAPLPRRRDIVQAEALGWLDAHPAGAGTSVVTSLPDVSEVPELGFDAWRAWFVGAARRVIRWVPLDGVAVFYQSDIRRGGTWVDKGYLIARAAEEEAAPLLWHKIVCRRQPGMVTYARASYSHMLCVSRVERKMPRSPGPDVLVGAGFMPYSKAMGVEACKLACRFLKEETSTRTVVDPFCGKGTALAVANLFGFDAVGVDRSARCCRAARRLDLGAAG